MAGGAQPPGVRLDELRQTLAELRKGSVIRASFHESGALAEVLLAPPQAAKSKAATPLTAIESKRQHYAAMLNLETVPDEMLEILP